MKYKRESFIFLVILALFFWKLIIINFINVGNISGCKSVERPKLENTNRNYTQIDLDKLKYYHRNGLFLKTAVNTARDLREEVDRIIINFQIKELEANVVTEIQNLDYHYIRFGCYNFTSIHLTSLISVLNFTRSKIFVHSNCVIHQNLSIDLKNRVKFVAIHKNFSEEFRIFNRKIEHVAHKSDVYRLLILLKYGGIYIDDDIWVLKDLQKTIRKKGDFSIMMSEFHTPIHCLSNAFIVALKSNSSFLKTWLANYRYYDFIDQKIQHQKWLSSSSGGHPNYIYWIWFSLRVPWNLWKTKFINKNIDNIKDNEQLIILQNGEFVRPGQFTNDSLIFDWSKNYNVHVNQRTLSNSKRNLISKILDDKNGETCMDLKRNVTTINKVTCLTDQGHNTSQPNMFLEILAHVLC